MKPYVLYCLCYPIMGLILCTAILESFKINSLLELGWKVMLYTGILLVIFRYSEKVRADISEGNY